MLNEFIHPGRLLSDQLERLNISQRDFSNKIGVAQSLLNNILNGSRNININIALSLEAAGLEEANYWMKKQMEYSLHEARNDKETTIKNDNIRILNEIDTLLPLGYLNKHLINKNIVDEIYKIFEVTNVEGIKNRINNYQFNHFRKSSKFKEIKNNILTWTLLAEYKAMEHSVNKFFIENEDDLISELRTCFYENKSTLNETTEILKKYGIKLFFLDRPSQTPVDGKSFMSDKNPAIVLSLKYKRLDNFAFNIMHELGHIFLHLTKPKYEKHAFFSNSKTTDKEEFEANNYARNKLININKWNDFTLFSSYFSDDVICDFSKDNKIHPAIVRGRVCFENNEYYRRRTSINKLNILT